MMAANTSNSKTEYLKRYLGGEKKEKRKKKPKPSSSSLVPRIKIVDKNIDVKAIKFGDEVDVEEDEAPVVAEVIDDRPEEVKLKEVFDSSRWKKLDSASEDEHLRNLSNSSQKRTHSDDNSPRQNKHSRKRMDSDSDCSPPRISRNSHNKKLSRHDSGSDLSPPRNSKRLSKGSNRHDSGSDLSPPRQGHKSRNLKNVTKHNSDSDISPPRRNNTSQRSKVVKRHDSDESPPRRNDASRGSRDRNQSYKVDSSKRKVRNDSDSDLSPERQGPRKESSKKSRGSDSDLSPPRKNSGRGINLRDEKMRPSKTLSGLKAGLQNAETLRLETNELRHREKEQIEKLGAELSGRDARTVVRDRKTGKRRDLEEEDREKEEKERRLSEQQKKYSEWGKGIEQSEKQKSKFSEDLYEMSKPMARHRDDDDLEEMLKARIDAEDPMAEYMLKKRKQNDAARMPEYSGPPPPPNRFGIKPGYRWDGVDRSNGFERKYFEKINSSKATEEEAYLWSVQDM
ncbi:hypothetical protein JTE90_020829 [Oedothorax gibbosus]|uniref:BUD13 homolog n=1 Tax=Oedothorax gibbosus TaxID=931172 RepID=A0AAV6U210_9ARAC|nr:hypothetical protein JTE90_020829 [Oedothorax gibbosus]